MGKERSGMTQTAKAQATTTGRIRRELAEIAQQAPPALARLALWLQDNLPLVAFSSVRKLAGAAGTSPNTVMRLAQALGFDGYDDFRESLRLELRGAAGIYGERVRDLRQHPGGALWELAARADLDNIAALYQPQVVEVLDRCASRLLAARCIHTVGARSCFGVAHHFAYLGGIAFGNFSPAPSLPGMLVDQMATAATDDVVVAIAYEHYSSEVVLACDIARDRGVSFIALTDRPSSPIVRGAAEALFLPMGGPHIMPSLTAAFSALEALLTVMASRSEDAAQRVADHERRVRDFGGYIPSAPARRHGNAT